MEVRSVKVKITPRSPQVLGASGTAELIESLHGELEANIVALSAAEQEVVIVSLDALYPGRLLREGLEARLATLYSPDQIFLAASHTHNAPAIDVDKPKLGAVDLEYVRLLIDSLVDAIVSMRDQDPTQVELAAKAGYADNAINRRLPRFLRISRSALQVQKIGLGPNPHGPRNEIVSMILLESASGPVAVLWSYACHPTSAPLPLQMDAHFPGRVRNWIRRTIGVDDLPVVFLQGFSGDIRPPAFSKREAGLHSFSRRVRFGPAFRRFSAEEYEAWNKSVVDSVEKVWNSKGKVLGEYLRLARCELPIDGFARGGATGLAVSFHGIDLGGLVIVGVSGEVVTEYSQRLQSHFPANRTIGVGCIDNTFGYVPTQQMLHTGGYEDTNFCRSFELTDVSDNVEDSMMLGFAQIASDLQE